MHRFWRVGGDGGSEGTPVIVCLCFSRDRRVSVPQSNPVAYWRLNDPHGSTFIKNYGSAGVSCDATLLANGGLQLEAPCALFNDSSRFLHSKCIRIQKGVTRCTTLHSLVVSVR